MCHTRFMPRKSPNKIEQMPLPPPGPRLIGYARVSTTDQRLDLQKEALRKAGVHPDNLHEDYASGGAKAKRRGLKDAMMDAREGDTFVVWKLDRFGRDVSELLSNLQKLESWGVGFRSLTEGLDTTTAVGKLILHVMAAIAQFERDITRERTAAGMRSAAARGVRMGAKPKLTLKQKAEVERLLRNSNLPTREIAKRFKVSPGTIYNAFPGGRSGLKRRT